MEASPGKRGGVLSIMAQGSQYSYVKTCTERKAWLVKILLVDPRWWLHNYDRGFFYFFIFLFFYLFIHLLYFLLSLFLPRTYHVVQYIFFLPSFISAGKPSLIITIFVLPQLPSWQQQRSVSNTLQFAQYRENLPLGIFLGYMLHGTDHSVPP